MAGVLSVPGYTYPEGQNGISPLAPPGVARLPFLAGSTPAIAIAVLLLVFAGPVYDLIRYRKMHWAYVAGIIIIAFSLPPVVLPLSHTSLWKEIAKMLLR